MIARTDRTFPTAYDGLDYITKGTSGGLMGSLGSLVDHLLVAEKKVVELEL